VRCRRDRGFGHRQVRGVARWDAEMRAARPRPVAGRLSVRQVLPVRAATGVQHQAAADRGRRVAQTESDILAAQHIHGPVDHLFPEQQQNGRDPEGFSEPAAGTGKNAT